jgi:hypothetical protein
MNYNIVVDVELRKSSMRMIAKTCISPEEVPRCTGQMLTFMTIRESWRIGDRKPFCPE